MTLALVRGIVDDAVRALVAVPSEATKQKSSDLHRQVFCDSQGTVTPEASGTVSSASWPLT